VQFESTDINKSRTLEHERDCDENAGGLRHHQSASTTTAEEGTISHVLRLACLRDQQATFGKPAHGLVERADIYIRKAK